MQTLQLKKNPASSELLRELSSPHRPYRLKGHRSWQCSFPAHCLPPNLLLRQPSVSSQFSGFPGYVYDRAYRLLASRVTRSFAQGHESH